MLKNENQVQERESKDQKPIRLRPAIIIVSIQWISWLVFPTFAYAAYATAISVFSGMLGGLALLIWWMFFSRIPKMQRWIALVFMVLALFVMPKFTHETIRLGMGGLMFIVYALPTLCLALVIWAAGSKKFSKNIQWLSLFAAILISCGIWILVQANGLSGTASADFFWRWTKLSDEKMLVKRNNNLEASSSSASVDKNQAEWTGFRGLNRDSRAYGLSIETDWNTSPPVELWRWPIGGGCSSFSIHGKLFYTQEQNGELEIVSCYNLSTGEPVWMHRDSARFYDQHVGVGPRSTPTLHNGFVYTLGATGILNALNAENGQVIWSRNAASDTDTKDSGWGYASSPLVVDSFVIVAAIGKLAAYDLATGETQWIGTDGGDSYSSPHLMTINGVKQVVLMSATGAISVQAVDGKVLWEHKWPKETRIVQPALAENGDLVISASERKGMRRLAVKIANGEWTVEELWTSTSIRTDFNDFVIHKGCVFGFDGPNIACFDASDGSRKWRGGRYGGQLLLLADQDLLLMLSEKGELVLVEAKPEKFTELAKIPAIEGKTWNHPALAGDILLVRNTKEMVAFRLPVIELQQ